MSTTTQDHLGGQRALVTGATSGIGRAVALQLAQDRAEVLVHGRDKARGAKTLQEITAVGGKASFVAAHLGDPADVQRLADAVGEVDSLINNAGISRFAPTAELDLAAFDKMFASNVRAVHPRRGAGSRNGGEGGGSIVSVSSMAGGVGPLSTARAECASTRSRPDRSMRPRHQARNSSGHSEKPRRCTARHNPRRSPRSSRFSPPVERATSPARPCGRLMADAERSSQAIITKDMGARFR
jgi:hypothetical protein